MINQERFDLAVGGLIKQGCCAYDTYEGCQYENEKGHKCIVGQFLTDEQRIKCEELGSIFSWPEELQREIIGTREEVGFWQQMQYIHDHNYDNFGLVLQKFKALASIYDLEWRFSDV